MTTKEAVLARLSENCGSFISGEAIASSLGLTRATVWKAVRELNDEGYGIEAVRNSGYRMPSASAKRCMSALLSAERIEKYLTSPLPVRVYRSVDSTNRIARELAAESGDALIAAASQSAGRGRLGRTFFSPEGSGLYMSLLLHPDCEAGDSVLITTAAAVAAARAIDALRSSDESAKIKWVNDIYLHGRKVCGILTEAQLNLETARLDYAVLGIGLNVLTPDGGYPPEIADRAGAIFDDSDVGDLLNRLAAEVTNQFMRLYPALDKRDFLDDYRARDFLTGREVTVFRGSDSFPAVVTGIDGDLRLTVRKADGETVSLGSGEVSLKL